MLSGKQSRAIASLMSSKLTPEKALIFRIIHRGNVGAMFRDGLHCSSSRAPASSAFTQIGNLDLIEKRKGRKVDCPPGGVLPDYIPFYFTPFTPMMNNIVTGYNGVQRQDRENIIIFVSSLHKLVRQGVPFVFSDRHAYLTIAKFTNDLGLLGQWIDWETLQARNFRKDNIDRFERYQAEALIHRHMPITSLLGAVCYDENAKKEVETRAMQKGLKVDVVARPKWYL